MIELDFKDLHKVARELKKKGYCIEDALLFIAAQIDKDIKDGVNVETYKDSKSDRVIELAMYASGRKKK